MVKYIVKHQPEPPKLPLPQFGIGLISGSLYMRVGPYVGGSPWSKFPRADQASVVCVSPGDKTDQQSGTITIQEDRHIAWLPAGTTIELTT